MDWDKIPTDKIIQTTAAALESNGVDVFIVKNSAAAKAMVLEIIPHGAEVMTMTSQTVENIGLATDLNDSGNYNSVRQTLTGLPKDTDPIQKLKIGAAPEWAVGSVHAITEDGKIMVASQSGSQLPAYASGSAHVVWVVGAQKIVPDLNTGWKRISEYVLPLESARAHSAYHIPANLPGSAINKLFILNKETKPHRLTVILVKEILGF
ncbi:MAG: LUD domain-containing protein [Candidatus Magasanikbacteria bacterium]|nr:LUD domain-containing protein [Candidatus Magasanikbacteria bacterium]